MMHFNEIISCFNIFDKPRAQESIKHNVVYFNNLCAFKTLRDIGA